MLILLCIRVRIDFINIFSKIVSAVFQYKDLLVELISTGSSLACRH